LSYNTRVGAPSLTLEAVKKLGTRTSEDQFENALVGWTLV